MLVHIRVTCFSKKYMQTESKVIILLSSQSKIMASEEKKNSSSDPDNVVQIPLSDYAKKLDGKVRERYVKKISTIGIDPALIEGKHFEPDCLPPVESTDLLCYLVLETSFYTQKQFKAFRSLEAYNQMVSGFVYNVQGHMVASKFVVLAKVRHSQRMNEALIPIWIITEKDGTINCAHCLGYNKHQANSHAHDNKHQANSHAHHITSCSGHEIGRSIDEDLKAVNNYCSFVAKGNLKALRHGLP